MSREAHFHTLNIRLAGVDRNKLRRKNTNRLLALLIVLALAALAAEFDRDEVQARAGVAGLGIAPANVQFAAQEIDTNSTPQLVTFQNSGATAIDIGSLTLSNPSNFSLDLRDCPDGRVAPRRSCAAIVTFHPSRVGAVNGSLERARTMQRVSLEGSGIARLTPPPPPPPPPQPEVPVTNPAANLTPERFLYGALEIDRQKGRTFVLKNSGNVELQKVSFRLQGEHLDEFNLNSPNCGTLDVGKECKTDVVFVPREEGSHSVTLLAFSTAGELDRATLFGVGKPRPGPIAQISPNPMELGEKNRDGKVTITNTGQAALTIEGIVLDDSKNFEMKTKECMASSPLERGQSCTIAVKFKGKKSAQGLITVRHNDPTASAKVMLAADVNPSNKKKWATALFAAGVITAGVLTAATVANKPREAPKETPPVSPPPPSPSPGSINTNSDRSFPVLVQQPRVN
jgi:hypothetical protein